MQNGYSADGVFDVSAVFTDVAPMRGHRDMRRYWNEMQETWEGIRMDPLEAFDLGNVAAAVSAAESSASRPV